MRKLLLLSCSTVHGSGFLEYAREYINEFFTKNGVREVLFVPYANVESQQEYTDKVRTELTKWGFGVTGLNETPNPIDAVKSAQCIFIGGGNTFLLLKRLQEAKLIDVIRNRVLNDGIPYLGSSAGTNMATVNICTTNDMPITYPSSFDALALVPFNINPHYIDTPVDTKHMGETRETRIREYHMQSDKPPVLGLREGTFLHVRGDVATIGGIHPARLFVQSQETVEVPSGSDVSYLL